MLRKVLYVISALLFASTVQCAGPPKLNGSYIAWGEITQPMQEMEGAEFQAAFEESYDADTQNAAFVVWMNGQNVTYIKNFKTNQTFKYTGGKDCELTNEGEWVKSDYPPGLLTYEDDDGRVKFSISQLVDIPEKYLTKNQGVSAVYRGVPAKMWQYEIAGKDDRGYKKRLVIYSYWSDGTWSTSSNAERVPLGFVVAKTYWQERMKNISIAETVTNVFGFVSGAYDHKYFEPVQGVICADRIQTIPFPSVQNIKAISIHSEMVLPDYSEIRYIDTYFDPQSQLVRMDLERLRDEDPIRERKSKKYESEIAIGKAGVVFHHEVFENKFSCQVIPFKEYKNDLENLLDITQDLKNWKMGKLFGLNDTSYVYTGKTVKGDIPCHVFQGIRTDWPEKSANVKSLWEWCFNIDMSQTSENVLFLNDEVGLVSAQITLLESGKKQEYPVGFRMFHRFYEVTSRDPAILDATRFDISRCFEETEKLPLQFYLDLNITDDNLFMAENLTSDVSFLQKWKAAIYQHSEIPSYSLRIAKLTSTIANKKLYIKFLILGNKLKISPDLWADQPTAIKAQSNLKDKLNKGVVSISHIIKKGAKATTFTAAKQSVTPQINPDFKHHTLPPVTTITPTEPFIFSLRTEPDDGTTTSGDGTTTPGEGTTTPGDGTTTPEDRSTTPGDDTTTPGVGITTLSDGTITSGNGTTTPGDGTTTPGDGTTTPPENEKPVKLTGHQPGAVAGVSIVMLLVGIAVGSAGTFYKFYGLPSFIPGVKNQRLFVEKGVAPKFL